MIDSIFGLGLFSLLILLIGYFYYRALSLQKITGEFAQLKKVRKIILFDFDGTISDSFKLSVEIVRRLSDKYKLGPINDEKIELMREKGIRYVMQQSELSTLNKLLLVKDAKKLYAKEFSNGRESKLFSGMVELLKQLHLENYGLVLVTSNGKDYVENILQKFDLMGVFKVLCTDVSIVSKAQIIQKIVNQTQILPKHFIMVGDEIRDIESAKFVDIKSIAVSWGFQHRKALAAHSPDRIADNINELYEAIRAL